MAGRITPVIKRLHRLGKRRKGCFRSCQGTHHRRHIPVSKLIRQDQSGFCPYRHHRLITSFSFISRFGFLLPALDDRCVLIDCRDLLIRTSVSHFRNGGPIHRSQSLQRNRLVGNVGFLIALQPQLRFFDLCVLVKRIQKIPRGLRRRHPMPH